LSKKEDTLSFGFIIITVHQMHCCHSTQNIIGCLGNFPTSDFPKKMWDECKYHLEFLTDISNHFGISKLEDWYRISREDLVKWRSLESILKKRGGLIKLLLDAYPNYQWDKEKLSNRQKKSSQWCLYKILKEILPTSDTIEEYIHPLLEFSDSGHQMVFDICVPSLNLAFEYQGHQHFYDHVLFGDVKSHQARDEERREVCKYLAMTLIEVPYWWQRDKESILSLLHKYRPDIVPNVPGRIPFAYALKL